MLIDRYPYEDVFARVPELAQHTDPVLRQLDHLLDDDALYQRVRADLGKRYPLTLVQGRHSTPGEAILRLLVVKHLYTWSYRQTADFVADSLVLRWFCRIYFEAVPDASTLPQELPPLRMLLVWDNLTGHYTPDLILWLFAHGIMPLFTPLGGSYLNMAESVQRILKRRALDGQHPKTPEEIMSWLEATARGWNREPTPFIWGGKRQVRRQRARDRRHALGASGAYTRRPPREVLESGT